MKSLDLDTIKKQIAASGVMENELVAKYKILFVPILVVIFAGVIVMLVTIPQIITLLNTFKTIDELNAKKAVYQKKVADLERINVEDYRKDLDTALVALPVEKDIPGVMGELLVSLGGSGLALEGITFSNSPPESDKLQEYMVTIDVSGDEISLKSFLERVTVAPRLIKLTGIEVSRGNGTDIGASITFTTFYQALPNALGSVDEKLPVIGAGDTQILADIETKIKTFPKVTSTQTGSSAQGKLDPFRP
jgi:Tfp pilus assembly protein PilO